MTPPILHRMTVASMRLGHALRTTHGADNVTDIGSFHLGYPEAADLDFMVRCTEPERDCARMISMGWKPAGNAPAEYPHCVVAGIYEGIKCNILYLDESEYDERVRVHTLVKALLKGGYPLNKAQRYYLYGQDDALAVVTRLEVLSHDA